MSTFYQITSGKTKLARKSVFERAPSLQTVAAYAKADGRARLRRVHVATGREQTMSSCRRKRVRGGWEVLCTIYRGKRKIRVAVRGKRIVKLRRQT